MDRKSIKEPPTVARSPDVSKLAEQYGCGPVRLAGVHDSLYERHLLFDNVVDRTAIDLRQSFEAFARTVRDVLSQRWVLTQDTYTRENPKRMYYLSMEFLIGRSLANNVTNLLLSDLAQHAIREAAPAYQLAKLIIKFVNNLADTIDVDPAMNVRLKVASLPEYCASLAELLIPASDVSNQISTAGYAASGTSNMRFS